MNDDRTLERRITASYDASAPSREPGGLLDTVLLTTGRSRQRPRWLAIIKEPPMRISSRVAVGSPTARVMAVVAATLLVAAVGVGAVVAGGSALIAGAGPIVVAQDGSGTYTSIVEAVSAAQDGDTILIRPGTYIGTVVIDKDIELRGDGPPEEIVIEFTADSPTIRTPWATLPFGILLADTTATVSDLSVHGPNVATAFVIVGGAPTIERVTTMLEGEAGDSPHSGVGLVHGASATIRESTMDGPIWHLGDPTMPGYEDIEGAGAITVMDSVIDYGIWVTTVDGSSVTGIPSPAMARSRSSLTGGGSAEVSGNTASSITMIGDDSTGLTVRDNTLRGGESGVGITLAPGSPLIEGNDIGDVDSGIVVPADATPTIRSNVIQATESAIVVNGVTTAPVIEANQLCGGQTNLSVPEGLTLTLDPSNEVCPASASAG